MYSPSFLPSYREHFITSRNALSLYVRDYGTGGDRKRTVLCLGGLTRNSKDFHDVAERLCRRYRIICPDYRGRGRSEYDPDWSNYSPPTYIDDVRQITSALNIHEYAVIGTSLGGILAMGLGAVSPAALKGVLLNDVSPDLPMDMLGTIVRYARATPVLSNWHEASEYLHNNAPAELHPSSEHAEQLVRNTFRERVDGKIVFDWDPNITRQIAETNVAQTDMWPLFSTLRNLPILLVRGQLSPFVSDHTWQKMTECASQMTCSTVLDVGHAPTLAEEECHEAIDIWLNRCFDV